MNLADRCLICNKLKRKDFESEPKWRSDIWIVIGNGYWGIQRKNKFKVTVCPKCRRKPIEMIYGMIAQRMLEREEVE